MKKKKETKVSISAIGILDIPSARRCSLSIQCTIVDEQEILAARSIGTNQPFFYMRSMFWVERSHLGTGRLVCEGGDSVMSLHANSSSSRELAGCSVLFLFLSFFLHILLPMNHRTERIVLLEDSYRRIHWYSTETLVETTSYFIDSRRYFIAFLSKGNSVRCATSYHRALKALRSTGSLSSLDPQYLSTVAKLYCLWQVGLRIVLWIDSVTFYSFLSDGPSFRAVKQFSKLMVGGEQEKDLVCSPITDQQRSS